MIIFRVDCEVVLDQAWRRRLLHEGARANFGSQTWCW